MWFSSLTPFSSSYRQEIASSSEAQLKEHASARPEARADNEEQTASPPARDQISVKSQVVATTAGPAKSADQTAVELSDVARRVLEMNKPQDVAQMTPEAAKSKFEQLTAMRRLGGPFLNMSVTAVLGDQKTDSMETYLKWLQERGRSADPNKMVLPLSLVDLKA